MSRRINRTIPLKSVGRLVEWCESVKHSLINGKFEEVATQYAYILDNEFRNSLLNQANRYIEHEHTSEIISHCYFDVEQRDKDNWKITIGNNSPKFKYFEYGTGKTGNTYKNNYRDNPESKGWKYMSGRRIIRTMGGHKYWTVRMYPDGHKEVLSSAIGGWKFEYKGQTMFTFGQPGAFTLTQLKRRADDTNKTKEVKKSVMAIIPNIPNK